MQLPALPRRRSFARLRGCSWGSQFFLSRFGLVFVCVQSWLSYRLRTTEADGLRRDGNDLPEEAVKLGANLGTQQWIGVAGEGGVDKLPIVGRQVFFSKREYFPLLAAHVVPVKGCVG